MHVAYQKIPYDSIDVRANKYRREITNYLNRAEMARIKGNKPKERFYLDLVTKKKRKWEELRHLKEMGYGDIFLQADEKKKLGITY